MFSRVLYLFCSVLFYICGVLWCPVVASLHSDSINFIWREKCGMRRDCRWCSQYPGSPAGLSCPTRQVSRSPQLTGAGHSSCTRQSGPGVRTTGSPLHQRWQGRLSGPGSWTRSLLRGAALPWCLGCPGCLPPHISALQDDQVDSNVSGN